jgi:hypothetical protein
VRENRHQEYKARDRVRQSDDEKRGLTPTKNTAPEK